MLYGGAAGGGKSYALCADPFPNFNTPGWNGLLLRRTKDELIQIEQTTKELYGQVFGDNAKFSVRDKKWTFPSGATLWLTFLDKDKDADRYQGHEYQWVGFDELTHWPTPYAWNYLFSRVRNPKGTGLYMRATTNPGGAGHAWVKKMFIDPAPWGEPFWGTDIETGEVLTYDDPSQPETYGKPLVRRRFIPAKLTDNPTLAEDGDYMATLMTLPEVQKRQLLYGDWDIATGAAFTEFNRQIHTVEPFNIPDSWTRFRGGDYGYNDPSAVLWFAEHPKTRQLIVYRELYEKGVLGTELAKMILEAEEGEKIKYGVLDASVWSQKGESSFSVADKMIMAGCKWRRSDKSKGSRVAGKNEIHARLRVNEFTGEPGLLIFNTCVKLIEQLPSIPLDKNNSEDVDTKSEDHLYDALRYGCSSRPLKPAYVRNMNHFKRTYRPKDKVFGY